MLYASVTVLVMGV